MSGLVPRPMTVPPHTLRWTRKIFCPTGFTTILWGINPYMLHSCYELTVSYASSSCVSLFLTSRALLADLPLGSSPQQDPQFLYTDTVQCLVQARFHAVADILRTLPYKVISEGLLCFGGALSQRREVFYLLTPYRGKYKKTNITARVRLSRYPRLGEEDPEVGVEHWVGRRWSTQEGYENPPFLVKKKASTLPG